MRAVAAFAFLLFLSFPAKAQSLIVHGISYHSAGQHNNNNFGVGFHADNGMVFGVYQNSEYRSTAYVGYKYDFNDYLAVTLGGAVGYSNRFITPLLMPTLSIPFGKLSFIFGVSPFRSLDVNRVGIVIHSMIEYRW
jgi:hypothetical protein